MNTQNSTKSDVPPGSVEQQLDALKAGLKKLVDRFDNQPHGYFARARQQIQAHPIAAVGLAFGIGYLVVRLVRSK